MKIFEGAWIHYKKMFWTIQSNISKEAPFDLSFPIKVKPCRLCHGQNKHPEWLNTSCPSTRCSRRSFRPRRTWRRPAHCSTASHSPQGYCTSLSWSLFRGEIQLHLEKSTLYHILWYPWPMPGGRGSSAADKPSTPPDTGQQHPRNFQSHVV